MSKRILILSHNPLSRTNNMGKTISQLFDAFEPEKVAQMFLRGGKVESDKFNNFYSISDYDMVKSCLGIQSYGSFVNAAADGNIFELATNKAVIKKILYKLGSRKSAIINIMRDSIWKEKHWGNEKLFKWLDDFSPQVIFYASGDSSFSYKIALRISQIYKIPLVVYFCDDYYFYSKKSLSPFYKIYIDTLRCQISKTIEYSKELVFISNAMEASYNKEFNKAGHVVMTPAKIKLVKFKRHNRHRKIILSYAGNISLRVNSLLDIGHIIDRYYKNEIEFNIYTSEKDKKQIKKLLNCDGINFRGSIDFNGVDTVLRCSDILIHTESFEEDLIKRVRYSISTKIPNLLAMGKHILAYGPKEVASINYLIENECAIVCTDKDNLKTALHTICNDSKLFENFNYKGIKIAKENHNIHDNSVRLMEILENAK